MKHIAVFASGQGSNFRSIYQHVTETKLAAEFSLLVSDRKHPGAADFAYEQGIPFLYLNHKAFSSTEEYAERLIKELQKLQVDWIILAGYLKLIPADVVKAFRHRIMNIHPALLPSFGGPGMYGHHVHEAVIASGVKITGATVHIVDEEYDTGPIVIQQTAPVSFEDTPETIAQRVLKIEHEIYPQAVAWAIQDKIKVHGRRVEILT
ncbi:phosphoribosylglycinamide formyltransferase [bacterium]|nr:phosphoribosylglycinamide formyltransferase [bacterium]MBU1881032.1 phosphoribosylglycinamide formyltransferase [bacterium]